MYGWFEPGGSINKFFINTKMQDVLLRSSSLNNNIVIGNSGNSNTSSAAIYVSGNSTGIKCLPDPAYALDVAATMRSQSLLVASNISANNIHLANNVLIRDNGLVQNELTISKQFKKPGPIIRGQVIRICTANMSTNTLNLIFEPSPDLEPIVANTSVQINGINYSVIAAPSTNEYILANYLPGDSIYPIPFTGGQVIDIQLLLDVDSDRLADVTTWFKVASSSITNDSWTGTVSFANSNQVDLIQGQYYSFGIQQTAQNLLKLTSLYIYQGATDTELMGLITLKTTDGVPFPSNWMIPSTPFSAATEINTVFFALILLDIINPPTFHDANTILGSYSSTSLAADNQYIMLKNSKVADCLNTQARATNSIRSISMNGIVSYDLSNSFRNEEGIAIAQLSFANTAYAFSIKGTASYSLVGVPIKITQITALPSSWRYHVQDVRNMLFSMLYEYVDSYMYVCCMRGTFCKILSVNAIQSSFVLDTNIIGSDPLDPTAIYYIIPFKQSVMTELGKQCHIENSLAIGTKISSETLTVKGDASFVQKILIHDTTNNTFPITFSSNVFSLGPVLTSTNNAVTLELDTTVSGNITANEFIQYSDKRIKRRIKDADVDADVELLKRIPIKDFEFKEYRGKPQKGVIAQDIEKLIPGIVSTKKGFVPSICKTFMATTSGAIIIPPRHCRIPFKKDMRLQVKVVGQTKSKFVNVMQIRCKKGSRFISLSEKFPVGTAVYIRGPYGCIKGINKDYLFMLLLNATKHLLNRSD